MRRGAGFMQFWLGIGGFAADSPSRMAMIASRFIRMASVWIGVKREAGETSNRPLWALRTKPCLRRSVSKAAGVLICGGIKQSQGSERNLVGKAEIGRRLPFLRTDLADWHFSRFLLVLDEPILKKGFIHLNGINSR